MENKANKLILIVDDNPHNIQLLAAEVSACGYVAGIAMNAEQALEFMEENLPSLILLDVMMPGTDGFELCQSIKKNNTYKDIPIIFLTAKNDKEDIIRGFEVGGVDYITKPFSIAELKMRIATHIELKQNRDRLANLNLELQQSSETKDKFFSIVARDLRNPFNGIIGLTEFLLNDMDKLDKDKIRPVLEMINQSSVQNYKLLEKLYEWSQIQIGSIRVTPIAINLHQLSKEASLSYLKEVQQKSINLQLELDSNINIYADYCMVYTVLQNLLANAIQHSENGGRIKISAKELKDKENRSITKVSVSDNGTGMKDAVKQKLFKIDQKSSSGSGNNEGTGLGLILCKELIERNNGIIWLEEQATQGACFSFVLPTESGDDSLAPILESDYDLGFNDKEPQKKPKSMIPSDLWQNTLEALMRLLEFEQIYLKDDLCLADVSKQLNTNRVYLSQIINETFNCNFNQLINEYRIKEFIRLVHEEDHNKLTIEALAFKVGFYNKATFNQSFKKIQGKTPSEYLKELKDAAIGEIKMD